MPDLPKAEQRASALDPSILPDVPSWARNYFVRSDPSGLLYLYTDSLGCDIYVVPKRWREIHRISKREGRTVDYGVDASQLATDQIPGTLVTNDPTFARAMQQHLDQHTHSATGQCPDPDRCPNPSPAVPAVIDSFLVPAAIIAGAVFLFFARRRRA